MHIGFQGYAGDCTITGKIEVNEARLSDALDRMDQLAIHDATLHSLGGAQAMYAGEMVLRRDDLFAVEASGELPTNEQRRVRTVRHALRLKLGPYVCYGEMHALPGVAPLRTILVRRTMVPLTNCLLRFRRGETDEFRRLPMLIVNGRLIDHVEETTTEELENELAGIASDSVRDAPASEAAPFV